MRAKHKRFEHQRSSRPPVRRCQGVSILAVFLRQGPQVGPRPPPRRSRSPGTWLNDCWLVGASALGTSAGVRLEVRVRDLR